MQSQPPALRSLLPLLFFLTPLPQRAQVCPLWRLTHMRILDPQIPKVHQKSSDSLRLYFNHKEQSDKPNLSSVCSVKTSKLTAAACLTLRYMFVVCLQSCRKTLLQRGCQSSVRRMWPCPISEMSWTWRLWGTLLPLLKTRSDISWEQMRASVMSVIAIWQHCTH